MFGKKKQQKNNDVMRTQIQTLIGGDTVVEGVIRFSGGLHVVGQVNGNIESDDADSLLIINEGGLVKGDVKVNHLIVNGQIDGNVFVNGKVELFDRACINGDVHYNLLELPVGAEVNGNLIRNNNMQNSDLS